MLVNASTSIDIQYLWYVLNITNLTQSSTKPSQSKGILTKIRSRIGNNFTKTPSRVIQGNINQDNGISNSELPDVPDQTNSNTDMEHGQHAENDNVDTSTRNEETP